MTSAQFGAELVVPIPWSTIQARTVLPPRLGLIARDPPESTLLPPARAPAAPTSWIEAWSCLPSRATDHAVLELPHVLRAGRVLKDVRSARLRMRSSVPSVSEIVAAHAELAPDAPAGLRGVPAWFGAGGPNTPKLLAPDADAILDLLTDLLSFLAHAPPCIVTTALVCHAQVGLIHPFCDGNGRIARLLARRVLHSHPDAVCAFDFYCTQVRLDARAFDDSVRAMALGDLKPLWRTWRGSCDRLRAAVRAICSALVAAAAELRSVGISAPKAERILTVAARSLVLGGSELQRALGVGTAGLARDLASMRKAGWIETRADSGESCLVPMPLLRAIDEAHRVAPGVSV